MSLRLGVVGWPVSHSRSPAMHNAALAATGHRDWRYQLLPVPPELFSETVTALGEAGFAGVNVTIPHKAAALRVATERTDRAAAIGAANTLVLRPDGVIVADNTDAPAIVATLPFAPAGQTALVLGAGGSARAAVWALAGAGAREVMIWNRSSQRARALAAALGARTIEASDRLPEADLLINCTAIGLRGEDPFEQLPLTGDELARYRCVVDLVYTPSGTRLIDAAAAGGIPCVDGLEILVGQGALSFEAFTGVPAPVDVMRAAARPSYRGPP